jgi:hypothetical protein
MASRNALLWLTRGAAGGWAFNDGMMAAGQSIDVGRWGTNDLRHGRSSPVVFTCVMCVPRPSGPGF